MLAAGRHDLSSVAERLTHRSSRPTAPPGFERSRTGPGFIIVIALSLAMLALVAIAPMGLEEQALFGIATCASANSRQSRRSRSLAGASHAVVSD